MLLKSARFVNFGTIENASIVFDNTSTPAIYVFNGDNGSGKSTIVKALSLLLINWCKGKLSDYIRWGCEFFEIECTFSHLGKEFFVFLRYDGGSSRKLVITEEGKEAQTFTNSAAIKHLESYFDPKIFRASAFSFEGEIDVIETSPAERRESLKKIHDVEFKEEIARAEAELAPLKEQLKKLDDELALLEGKVYQTMVAPALPFSEDDLKSKKLSLAALDSTLQQSLLINNEIDRKQKDVQNIPQLITDYDEQKKQASDEKTKKLEEEGKLSKELEALKKELDNLEETISNQFSEEREQLGNELADYRNDLASKVLVRPPAAPAPSLIEDLISDIARKKSQIEDADSSISILGTGVCPTCGKPVEQCELDKSVERKAELQTALSALETSLATARQNKAAYDEQVAENNIIKAEQARLAAEIRLLEAAAATLEGRRTAELKSETDRIQAAITLAETKLASVRKELESNRILMESLDKSKVDAQTRLVELQTFLRSAVKIDVTQQQADKKALSDEISSFSVAQGQIDQAKTHNAAIEVQKTNDQKLKVDLQAKKDVLLHKIQVAEKTVEIIKRDLPNFIISKLILSITESMNDFLKQTYKGRYQVQVLESRNALEVVYGPKNTDISLSSGYERQIINSAYKYAKEKMLGLGFLILDEVDSAASEANSKVFYKTLGELPYRQLIVITHKPTTKDLLAQDYGATVFTCKNGEIYS